MEGGRWWWWWWWWWWQQNEGKVGNWACEVELKWVEGFQTSSFPATPSCLGVVTGQDLGCAVAAGERTANYQFPERRG